MKKTILTLIAFILFVGLYSQTLMGIKLDRHVSYVVSDFQKKGFIISSAEDKAYIMEGRFLSYSNATLFVFFTPNTKQVYKILIYGPERETFESLSEDYEHHKVLFDAKYNKEDNCNQYWKSPYEKGDGYELLALKNRKYVRYCFYEDTGLDIGLLLEKYPQVKFVWEVKKNMELNKRERENNAINEL